MDQRDRQAIDELFGKLQKVDGQAPPRDAEAEALIKERVATLPASPYYMAQAIIVQEQALEQTQARVQQLEQEMQSRPAGGGGFLGGLFGGGGSQLPARPQPTQGMQGGYQPGQQRSGPWGGGMGRGGMGGMGGGGGGFLAGAAQTAIGVAGGMLVANAIMGAFAPETPPAPPEEAPADEPPPEEDFGGGDFGGEEM